MSQKTPFENLLLPGLKFVVVILSSFLVIGISCSKSTMHLTGKEEVLFDGTSLDKWTGNKEAYRIEDNMIVIDPDRGSSGGNLYTKDEFSDFIFYFEFQLTPGANNGLGIHAPLEGDAAYLGKEIQILDNTAEKYAGLKDYQYHGSVYGILPAKRGFLNPVGEWNEEEVHVQGNRVKVILNGTIILDGDL